MVAPRSVSGNTRSRGVHGRKLRRRVRRRKRQDERMSRTVKAENSKKQLRGKKSSEASENVSVFWKRRDKMASSSCSTVAGHWSMFQPYYFRFFADHASVSPDAAVPQHREAHLLPVSTSAHIFTSLVYLRSASSPACFLLPFVSVPTFLFFFSLFTHNIYVIIITTGAVCHAEIYGSIIKSWQLWFIALLIGSTIPATSLSFYEGARCNEWH